MNYIYKSIAAGKLVGIVDKKVFAVAIFFVIAFLRKEFNKREKEETEQIKRE